MHAMMVRMCISNFVLPIQSNAANWLFGKRDLPWPISNKMFFQFSVTVFILSANTFVAFYESRHRQWTPSKYCDHIVSITVLQVCVHVL